MKKLALLAALLLVTTSPAFAQNVTKEDYGLPELHAIKSVTLAPSYSCRSQEEFRKGYEGSALFISAYAKRRNSPELLFNGACRSDDEFNSADMSFLVDLGPELQLEKVTAQDVLQLYQIRSSPSFPYSKHTQSVLARSVKVVPGHTYAVFLNTDEVKGMFIFTVINHTQNQRVELKYAVKEYQIMMVRAQSPGFSWEQKNTAAQTNPTVEKAQGGKP